MLLRDRATGKPLYEARASNEGLNSGIAELLAPMYAAALTVDPTLRARAGALAPQVAVLLGSGWQPVAERVTDAHDVPYGDLPAFPVLGVGGHVGTVRIGQAERRARVAQG